MMIKHSNNDNYGNNNNNEIIDHSVYKMSESPASIMAITDTL